MPVNKYLSRYTVYTVLLKKLTFRKFLKYIGLFLTFLCREWARSLEFIYRRDFGTEYVNILKALSCFGALFITAALGMFYEIKPFETATIFSFGLITLGLGFHHVGQANANAQHQLQNYDPEDIGASHAIILILRLQQRLTAQFGIQPTSKLQTFLSNLDDREAKLFIEPGVSFLIGTIFASFNFTVLASILIFGGLTIAIKTLIFGHQQHQTYNRYVKGKAKARRTTTLRQKGVIQTRKLRTQQIKKNMTSNPGRPTTPQAKPPPRSYRKNP